MRAKFTMGATRQSGGKGRPLTAKVGLSMTPLTTFCISLLPIQQHHIWSHLSMTPLRPLPCISLNENLTTTHKTKFGGEVICLSNIYIAHCPLYQHFCHKIFMSRLTHFFRRFFVTEKQPLQTFLLLECMMTPYGRVQRKQACKARRQLSPI